MTRLDSNSKLRKFLSPSGTEAKRMKIKLRTWEGQESTWLHTIALWLKWDQNSKFNIQIWTWWSFFVNLVSFGDNWLQRRSDHTTSRVKLIDLGFKRRVTASFVKDFLIRAISLIQGCRTSRWINSRDQWLDIWCFARKWEIRSKLRVKISLSRRPWKQLAENGQNSVLKRRQDMIFLLEMTGQNWIKNLQSSAEIWKLTRPTEMIAKLSISLKQSKHFLTVRKILFKTPNNSHIKELVFLAI